MRSLHICVWDMKPFTYIYTGRKVILWKRQFEVELIDTLLETSVAAQDNFIFKERRKTVSQVFTASPPSPGA